MTEKPLLLLSNDDGFDSKGLKELIETLRPMADLIVVAFHSPLRFFGSHYVASASALQFGF